MSSLSRDIYTSANHRQGRIPDDAFEGEETILDDDDLANDLFDPIDMDNIPDDLRGALSSHKGAEKDGDQAVLDQEHGEGSDDRAKETKEGAA